MRPEEMLPDPYSAYERGVTTFTINVEDPESLVNTPLTLAGATPPDISNMTIRIKRRKYQLKRTGAGRLFWQFISED